VTARQPKKMMSSIVLFFGAGASAPLGKMLMREFVQHLANVVGEMALFRDIVSKQPDLEFLLEELRDLETKSYLGYQFASAISGVPRPLGAGLEAPRRSEQNFSELATAARDLRRRIEREIFYHYRSFDQPGQTNNAKDHFGPLFMEVGNRLAPGEPIVVFTTNYDPGVEEFCLSSSEKYVVTDGFAGGLAWAKENYQDWTEESGMKAVILVKLHGSTDWFRDGGRIIKGPPVFAPDDPRYPNLIIYPAANKVAIEEPFFTSYELFQETASTALCILAVGYSFRDLDALARLKSAAGANPRLKIGLVAPDAARLADHLRTHGVLATPINGAYDPRVPEPVGHLPSSSVRSVLEQIRSFLTEASDRSSRSA